MKFMPGIEIAGVPVLWMFGRPRPSVARSIKDACRLATEENACLFILADTAEQLEPAVRLATKRLPHHRTRRAGTHGRSRHARPRKIELAAPAGAGHREDTEERLMGMDICGLNPTGERGEYFRNSGGGIRSPPTAKR